MAKKLQFKNSDTRLVASGIGEITNLNITQDKYDKLIALNPSHAELFEEKEVDDTPLFISRKQESESKNLKPKHIKNDIQTT